MEKLLNSCKKLINDNYKYDLDDDVLNVLSVAVLALYLKDEKMAEERLPGILQDLTIYAENRPVLDIAIERIEDYQDNNSLEDSTAAVIRDLELDDCDDAIVYEKRNLLIDMRNTKTNVVKVIHNVVHEFTHLYRFGGIENTDNEIKVYEGISLARYNKEKDSLSRKHHQLEEGIVQRFTHQTLDFFHNYLEDQNLEKGSLLYFFRRNYPSQYDDCYLLQTSLLDSLCQDKKFSEAIDESFYDITFPSKVANYYNSVMGSGTSFSLLSRNVDKCYEYVCLDDKKKADDSMTIIRAEINKFMLNSLKNAQKKKI